MRRLAVVVALAALADIGPRRPRPVAVAAPVAAPVAPHAPAPAVAPRPAPAAVTAPPPRSLAGTDVDGALAVDGAGDLVVDEDLRRFFDYFLAATGEEPDAVIRARVEAAIDARLPPRAARQARELFARYVGCRDGARALQPLGDLAERIQAVRQLRARCLGADAAARMYATPDRADDVALARWRAVTETEPGGAERAERLGAIAAAMPEAARAVETATTAPLIALAHEQELRAAGAPPDEIRAVRAAAFGSDGADRLEALDRERAAWQARLDGFRAERARLADDPTDVAALLARDFTPAERVRVEAIERIAGRPLPP
jgi:lipase chaperone LimK